MASFNTSHCCAALQQYKFSSLYVTSFSDGYELAVSTTRVPINSNSLTKGKIPKIKSTPALSTKMTALLNVRVYNNNNNIRFEVLKKDRNVTHI